MLKNRYVYFSLIWFIASVYALFLKPSAINIAPPFPHFDKVVHCGLFFAQTWLLGKIWLTENWQINKLYLLIPMIIWAGLSEVLQSLLTRSRHGDVWDMLADIVGILFALFFLQQSQSCKHPTQQP